MNIALYISGRTKLYDKWLINQVNSHTENKIDVFCSFNEEQSEDFISTIKPVKVNWEIYKLPEKWSNVLNRQECTNIQNMCSMFYNNKKAFELIDIYSKEQNIKYDLIVKFRPDIINNNLPLFFKTSINEIHTPSVHVFGWPGMNDMIAFGDFESMKVYSNIYDCIDDYINKGITIKTFNYNYDLDKDRFNKD